MSNYSHATADFSPKYFGQAYLVRTVIEWCLEQLVDELGPESIPERLINVLDVLDDDPDLELEPDRELEVGDCCYWPNEGGQCWKYHGAP